MVTNFFIALKTDYGYNGTQCIGIKSGISSVNEKDYELLQMSKSFKQAVAEGTIVVNDSKLIAEYQKERVKNDGTFDNRGELVKLSAENAKLKKEFEDQKRELESLKQLVIESTGSKSETKKNANSH